MKKIQELSTRIADNISSVIVGRRDVIDLMVLGILCQGHVLIEDVPGTGKTVMARALARSIDSSFKRIQFTPDLLPSDITGMNIYNPKDAEFIFREGPVFCNVLLADEINRATPRTQSALLECMEESQITIDGETRILQKPFFIVATQNPLETKGTFPLPEAQLDRFLMRLSMGYPTAKESVVMLERFRQNNPTAELKPVATAAEVAEALELARNVYVSAGIFEYITKLAEATRESDDVVLGVSPRAMLALMRSAQMSAAMAGRDFVLPDDVKRLLVPVFAHRIIWQSGLGLGIRTEHVQDFIKSIGNKTPPPTESEAKRI